MSEASLQRSAARKGRLVLAVYIASVFLSALLLFGVQPMFARMVLPQLGGSPSVWSVAMVFFQSMLLAGYAYAHWLGRVRSHPVRVAIHMALLCAAWFALPLAIASGWGMPPASGTAFWLLGLFAASIGLPFFALSANNPLLQDWFVHTGHREGHDPYFLYAASNVGSFLALLSYPFLLEPVFALPTQIRMWSYGFGTLVLLIGACGLLLLRAPAGAGFAHVAEPSASKPERATIAGWIFRSAVPSGLLVAVTAYISTDVASAPLLWVVPLSLYLLTWVLVFQRNALIPHRLMLWAQPFAVAVIIILLLYTTEVPLLWSLAAHLAAFFVIAMACHGDLAASRPPPAHLTAFYVALSFGGMVGGLFAGLIAPYAFSWVAEYPILATLAVLCRPRLDWRQQVPARLFWAAVAVIVPLLIVPAYLGLQLTDAMAPWLILVVLGLAVVSLAVFYDPWKSAAVAALAFAVTHLYPTDQGRSESLRSFFGVHTIYETQDRRFRVLRHGSTIHGAQELFTADGKPVVGKPRPLTYYHDGSAMAAAISAVRARKGAPLKVAVIGLGAGSLACRMAPGESWRFFEIDPLVIDIARDPKRFRFLSACAPDVPIVTGDARLTLAHEPDGAFDLIVVDAYSSDAIPVHLATREAMAIYKSKLAPHGVVTMHLSNRHLALADVAVGIAAANDLKTWIWINDDDEDDDDEYIAPSSVAVSALTAGDIGALAGSKLWQPTPPQADERVWTDDYSNIVGAIWRKYREQ